jgi:hypothetical protein
MDSALIPKIIKHSRLLSLPRDACIQQSEDSQLFVILLGKLSIASFESGKRLIHRVIKAGDFFGRLPSSQEPATPYSFIVASDQCKILDLPSSVYQMISESNDFIAMRIALQIERRDVDFAAGDGKSMVWSTATISNTRHPYGEQFYDEPCNGRSLVDCKPALIRRIFGSLPLRDRLSGRHVCSHWARSLRRFLPVKQVKMQTRQFCLQRLSFVCRASMKGLVYLDLGGTLVNVLHVNLIVKECPKLEYFNLNDCKWVNKEVVKVISNELPSGNICDAMEFIGVILMYEIGNECFFLSELYFITFSANVS